MSEQEISKATIGRMPLYLHFLQEESSKGAKYISSAVIAQNIPVSAVLVRKDLAIVSSQPGRPRLGFEVVRLIADIEKFLGYDNLSDAIIVGVGGLGKAFLGYEGFKSNGLNIVAAFDVDPSVIEERIAGKEVYALSELPQFVTKGKINIGLVTVPKDAAQGVVDLMVRSGIRAIWNFAPIPLKVPKGIIVKNEDLSASLALLAGELSKRI